MTEWHRPWHRSLAAMRPGAPVSMPVLWSQVGADLDPQRFTMMTAPALLARNKPWQEHCDCERSLKGAFGSW